MLDETAAPPPAEETAPPAPVRYLVVGGHPERAAEIARELGSGAEVVRLEGEDLRTIERAHTDRLPEAVQGEGGPLALAGDPPQSTNTEVGFPSEPPPPAPPPPEEQTVNFGKGVKVPYSVVRSFANPACPSHCQQGLIVRPGPADGQATATFCFCALKRCRDAIVGARTARAAARPLPGVSTQVNPRSLESLEKLTTRAARLDEQIAEADKAVADEIEHARQAVARDEENGAIVTRGIRQGEEAIAAFEEEKGELDRKKARLDETIRAVEARLAEARAQEVIVVAKAQACRRGLAALEERRDRRTRGMRSERERLGRRIALKLAHNPGVALPEASPAPAPTTPEVIAPLVFFHQQIDPAAAGDDLLAMNGDGEPVAPSSSAPAPEEKSVVPWWQVPPDPGVFRGDVDDRGIRPALGERVEIRKLGEENKPVSGWLAATPLDFHPIDGFNARLDDGSIYEFHNGHGPTFEWRRPVPAGPPEEKTPMVEVLTDGTLPSPAEEPAA